MGFMHPTARHYLRPKVLSLPVSQTFQANRRGYPEEYHDAKQRGRIYVHASNLPEGSKPVVAGWQFSTPALLPETPGSWRYVLDNARIPSQKTRGEVAALQLQTLVPLLPVRPLLLGDGQAAKDTKRDPKGSWFVFVGRALPPLCEVPAA